MKKLLIVITLLFASSTSAQYPTTSFTAGGNITAASASCLATNCVPIKLPASATTLTVGVTGTFSATLAVEESQDGGRTWTSAGSNITGAGTTSFTITAFSDFRVRASAYVSGNAGVNILVSASTNSGGGGGGSSSFASITSGTNTTAAMVCGTGCSFNVSGSGTANVTALDGVTLTGTPVVGELPTATSASTATWQPLITSGAFNLYSFGVKADGVYLADVSTTNGLPNVASAGEATWCDGGATPCSAGQNNSVGQTIVVWSNCQTNQGNYSEILGTTTANPTILSVTDSLHVVASANATATVSGTGCAVYGTNDDTALSTLDTFLASTTGCPALLVPAGLILTNEAHIKTQPTLCTKVPQNTGATGKGGGGLSVGGVSFNRSIFVLLPAFSFATCTGGVSGHDCFGGQSYSDWHDIQFSGLGTTNTSVAAANGKNGFGIGTGGDLHDAQFINFCPKCFNFTGIANESQEITAVGTGWNITNDGFGGQYGFSNASGLRFSGYNIGIQDVCVGGGAQISNQGYMEMTGTWNYAASGVCSGTLSSLLDQGGIFYGEIDLFTQSATDFGIRAEDTSQTTLFNKSRILVAGAGEAALEFPGPSFTAIVYLNGTQLSATTGAVACGNHGTIFDLGSNSGLSGCSTIFGDASITGTTLATGNVVLTSGWGSGAAASVFSGNSQASQWTSTIGTTPSTTAVTTVTFPTPFFSAPTCTAIINGGTSTAVLQTSCSATATAATITYLGTLVSGTVITTLRASN